jgi:REP element-mobilizing transposase RayT
VVEYRTSAHALSDIKYHVVWITKYRYKILRGDAAERARDLIRQICESRELKIIRGAVSPDHIHLLMAAPPHLAPSKIVQYIKGPFVPATAGGISSTAKAILGSTSLGTRLFLCDGGRGR